MEDNDKTIVDVNIGLAVPENPPKMETPSASSNVVSSEYVPSPKNTCLL